jgi:RNA-directed DNA polymerase
LIGDADQEHWLAPVLQEIDDPVGRFFQIDALAVGQQMNVSSRCYCRTTRTCKGAGGGYLNVSPSAKALKKEREKLHEMTDHRQCSKPIPQLIEELNRHLEGWKNYFDFGYPSVAFGEINAYVRYRLTQHLRRRSQRPFRPPEGVSFYEQLQRFGLVRL